jgi:ATP-dependent DNA ligase
MTNYQNPNLNMANLTDNELLTTLSSLYLEVNSTKGTNAKIEVFKKYPNALPLIDIIWNPNPRYKTGITQTGMDKFITDKASKITEYKKSRHPSISLGLVDTFMALVNKDISGDTARSKVATLMDKHDSTLVRDIMSRKQTTRVGYKNIAKAFPELWTDAIADSLGAMSINTSGKQFKDLLELGKANSFDENTIITHMDKLVAKGNKTFYFSLKMDGLNCRVIIIGDKDYPDDLSKVIIDTKARSGHSYTSLSLLSADIRKTVLPKLTKKQLLEGVMLVGEVRVKTDGEEDDFRSTVSAGRKKDVQMKNFRYDVYDFIPLPLFWEGQGYDENDDPNFEERYALLAKGIPNDTDIIKVVPQHLYTAKDLSAAIADTQKKHQEGLVIRDACSMYTGKRHNLFIKYKNYWNEEYRVDDIVCVNMEIKVNAKTGASESHYALKNIVFSIDDTNEGKYKKGTKNVVHVGSGFTPDQRIEFAKDPSKILSMWVTVKHYGVSENDKGTKSLRQGIFLNIIGNQERDY